MYIPDKDILSLIAVIIKSFSSISPSVGLPLGNLTSQLLVNVYMNEFDRFVKHSLKEKFYIRYADDFVIFSEDKKQIGNILDEIKNFLWQRLRLKLHPNKISIRTVSSGNDYLGWVHFPDHTILRTYTKKRMLKRLKNRAENPQTVQSYLGLLKHGNGKILQNKIRKYPS
jgi:hypothetical protein